MTMGNQPINYAPQPGGQYMPIPPKRPGSITTVAIFAIIMGSLGVLCCGVLQLVGAVGAMGEARMPDGTVIKQDPSVASVGAIMGIITVLTSGTLLAVGIGGLRLAKWARQLGIIVAVVILLLALTRFVITVTYTGPKTEQMMKKMEEAMAKDQKNGQAPPQMAKLMSSMTIGVGIAVLLLEGLTPVLILMLWTNKGTAKQAFESGPAAAYAAQMPYGPGPVAGQPPYGQGYPPAGNPPPGGTPPPPGY